MSRYLGTEAHDLFLSLPVVKLSNHAKIKYTVNTIIQFTNKGLKLVKKKRQTI